MAGTDGVLRSHRDADTAATYDSPGSIGGTIPLFAVIARKVGVPPLSPFYPGRHVHFLIRGKHDG
jgi:hypothetical protein